MFTSAEAALSRPIAAAAGLGEAARDRNRFHTKRVLLGGDRSVLGTRNGVMAFIAALRLLPRLCQNVTVAVPDGMDGLTRITSTEAARISYGPPVTIVSDAAASAYDAVLWVGLEHPGSSNLTLINSNGWLARVSSRSSLPGRIDQTNPVGAWAAASLGVAELFKTLVSLTPARGSRLDRLHFSLFSYAVETDDPGPVLPRLVEIDALVTGCGAIGNGIVAILRDLAPRGRLAAIDREVFGEENLGTCVLLDPSFIGKPKTGIVSFALGGCEGLKLTLIKGEVPEALASLSRRPRIVCNGLDNPLARRAMQHLWAELTIDGAIGDFMCQVGVHPGDPSVDVACLRCTVPEPAGQRWEQVAAHATGLLPERVTQTDDIVRDADVEAAPQAKREFLRAQIGRSICSVVDAETLAAISGDQEERFAASVAFVATMSAAMVVAELLLDSLKHSPTLQPRYQFDMLIGPEGGMAFAEGRHPDCDCVTRRKVIEALRAGS